MVECSSDGSSVRREIAIVAGPRDWGDTRESWLARVPRSVSTVSFRTVKALWYGEIEDPDHWAARDIRRAAEIIEGKKEAAALANNLETIIAGLDSRDPDFHRPEIAALLSALRQIRNLDRA